MSVSHLTARFFTSLVARPPGEADLAWVGAVLTPAERGVWETLGTADRAESVATARRAAAALGSGADDRWLAAALLHDVGKSDARLGTFRRAGATAVATIVGSRRARGFRNAIGRYVAHDDLGAALLRSAGARPEAVAWARAHHRPELWPDTGIPAPICELLAIADGER